MHSLKRHLAATSARMGVLQVGKDFFGCSSSHPRRRQDSVCLKGCCLSSRILVGAIAIEQAACAMEANAPRFDSPAEAD